MSRIKKLRSARVVPVMVLVALLGAVMATSSFAATTTVKHGTVSAVSKAKKKGKKKAKKTKKVAQSKVSVPGATVIADRFVRSTGAVGPCWN